MIHRDLKPSNILLASTAEQTTLKLADFGYARVLGETDLEGTILSLLPEGGPVADLGCGPGELLDALSAKAQRLIGVDASPAMLEIARKKPRLAGASLRVGELEHLPLADGEARAAVMSLTLHHLSDPRAALAEAGRVVAPGGVLVVADYLKHENELMRERFGDRWLGFSSQEVSSWLDRAGFTVERIEEKPVKLGLRLGFYVARRPFTEERG